MTKDELFSWVADNSRKYPRLDTLCEAKIDGYTFLFLPGDYGVYPALYLCFEKNPAVTKLRCEGYAVGIVKDYAAAKKILLECAKYTKKQYRRSKKNGKCQQRTD